MVFSQAIPSVRMNTKNQNQFKTIPLQNPDIQLKEFSDNHSFSLVTLFLKFIKEDYFTYGDLSIFKSYFEENCKDYIHYLLNLQEIKDSIVHSGYISNYLISNIKKSADKLEEMKKNKVSENTEEFKKHQNEYNHFQKQVHSYVTDLKINLSQHDNLGQTRDLSNLDQFQGKNEIIINHFFDEKPQENELEGIDKISSYLLRYTHAIYASVKDANTVLETTYCHDQNQFNFLNCLEFDISKIAVHKNFSYYYYIQEVSGNKNTYGLFIYFRFEKINLVFYNPQTGIKEFNYNELLKFKDFFNKLIKKYGKNYCSFRLKIQSKNKKIKLKSTVSQAEIVSILSSSASSYLDHIQSKKIKFMNNIIKEENKFCQDLLKSNTQNNQSSSLIANIFFVKYSELIQKLKRNYNSINEKSFWIFFLINYLATNEELAKCELNNLEPYLGKEKIFDFILNYFNKKISIPELQSKKIIWLIIIEVYKNISICDFRIPFYESITPFTLNKRQADIAKLLFESFDFDTKTTLVDWNRQNLIYNERYISKRYNGTYQSLVGFSSIGKLEIVPLNAECPKYNQLEHHFLSSTECFDSKLTKFCLGVCNQTHILGLGHVLKTHFSDPNSYLVEFNNHYIFIHKICPKIYDFMVVFYINQIIENNAKKSLKNPIYLSYVFTLDIKKEHYLIKNFNIGYLNKTISDNYSFEIKEKVLRVLEEKSTRDFYRENRNKTEKREIFYTPT